MSDAIQKRLEEYFKWLKDKTILKKINDWSEITTPFIDRHNDYLQIYIKKEGTKYILTDDSYIINDLKMTGVELSSKKRQSLLQMQLNGLGIKLTKENALQVTASEREFPLKKLSLIQAMLTINDMFYTSHAVVSSLFLEDVTNWLDIKDIRYIPNAKFSGKGGFDYLFNFAIPKSKQSPERIIQLINNPTKDTASTAAFKWFDTKDARDSESKAYVFLNDIDKNVASNLLDTLEAYEVKPVLWSEKDSVEKELAA